MKELDHLSMPVHEYRCCIFTIFLLSTHDSWQTGLIFFFMPIMEYFSKGATNDSTGITF